LNSSPGEGKNVREERRKKKKKAYDDITISNELGGSNANQQSV